MYRINVSYQGFITEMINAITSKINRFEANFPPKLCETYAYVVLKLWVLDITDNYEILTGNFY